MIKQWLSLAMAAMSGGGEDREQAAQHARAAEADSANGQRILREYAASVRAGQQAEQPKQSGAIAPGPSRALAMLAGTRRAPVAVKRPGKKPNPKKAPSPSFR